MRRLALAVLAASVAGCTCKPKVDEKVLLSEVRQRLAARDAALAAYRFDGEATQGGQTMTFRFAFKAPNKSRGEVLAPEAMALTLAFDGRALHRASPAQKTVTTYALELPPQESLVFLNGAFAPFVFEGFRTPLLPMHGVKAEKVARDGGGEAVRLTTSPGEGVEVEYLLSWPNGNVLERRLGDVRQVTLEEHCRPSDGLCVPKVVQQLRGDAEEARTVLTNLDLAAELDDEPFTLAAPEGWTAAKETMKALPSGQ